MTLESFDAEVPLSVDMPRAEVSLAEIAAGGGVEVWSEAVAVVEELCLQLTQDDREARVPALEDVLLDAQGQLRIVYGSRGDRGPVAAGRLLTSLLGGTEVPVQLRLFLSQATAPETHGSIREFAAALAYFGRPDRGELIQALHGRFASRPLAARSAVVPPPLSQDRFSAVNEVTDKLRRRRRAVRIPTAVWIAAALLVVVGAGAWFLNGGGSERTPTTAADVAGAMSGAFDDLAATARELMGEPRIVSNDADAGAAGREESASTVGGRAAAPRSTTTATRQPAAGGRSTASRAAVTPATASVSTSTPARAAAPATAAPVNAASAASSIVATPPAIEEAVAVPAPRETAPVAARAVASTGIIYSREDADVVPPSLLAPRLPQPLVTVEDREPTLNQMEVVVAPDGTVERVRLLEGPRRMPDMMLLSGAKTWRFEPAYKDGVPVRYRTILTWAVTP